MRNTWLLASRDSAPLVLEVVSGIAVQGMSCSTTHSLWIGVELCLGESNHVFNLKNRSSSPLQALFAGSCSATGHLVHCMKDSLFYTNCCMIQHLWGGNFLGFADV